MKVSDLGEFGLIRRLAAQIGAREDERLVVGVGDDAAVWRAGEGYVIATTDTMVAGVHFLPDAVSWEDVGWKALAVNISDVAAMGGKPAYALVTLALPPGLDVASIDALYAGLTACASAYAVRIAGGDVVSAPVFSVTVALVGDAYVNDGGSPLLLRRDGARPGDVVCVTGPLGGSAAGLRLLRGAQPTATGEQRDALVRAHMRPAPRVDAGDVAMRAGLRCGIDISDGLVQDLGHVCAASGVDAELRLDAIPVDDAARAVFGAEAPMLAATGGEDYELLLVGGAEVVELADAALRRRLDVDRRQLTVIGAITAAGKGSVRLLDSAGAEVPLAAGGWDHLAGKSP